MSKISSANITLPELVQSGRVVMTDSGVILHSPAADLMVKGSETKTLMEALLPLLEGHRRQKDIVALFERKLQPHVRRLLSLMVRQGLIEPAISSGMEKRSSDRFFRFWGRDPDDVANQLQKTKVLVVGLDPWTAVASIDLTMAGIGAIHLIDDAEITNEDLASTTIWPANGLGQPRAKLLVDLLQSIRSDCRLTCSPSTKLLKTELSNRVVCKQWDLVIDGLASDDLRGHLALAKAAFDARIPSLSVQLQAIKALVGPLVIPGRTPCWNCFRVRCLATADDPHASYAVQEHLLRSTHYRRSSLDLPPMASVAGHLASLESLKVLTGYAPSRLPGAVLMQNLVTLETGVHAVVAVPSCEVCGGPVKGERSNERIVLLGKQMREVLVAIEQAMPGWIDAETGVIADLRIRGSGPGAVPICAEAIVRYQPSGRPGVVALTEAVGGKGMTEAEALLGAVAEAVERYSASVPSEGSLIRCSKEELAGDVLDPRDLCLYEPDQYTRIGFPMVPFDPQRPHVWTQGTWLDNGGPVWVPALLTYYVEPDELGEDPYCQVTSSGLAASFDTEDAKLRATLELIERDAFMVTWLTKRPSSSVDLDELLDPRLQCLVAQLAELEVVVELFTLDSIAPTVTMLCVSRGDGKRWPGLHVGTAAHLDPQIAATKAVLEMAYSATSLRELMLEGRLHTIENAKSIRSFLDHAAYYCPVQLANQLDFLAPRKHVPLKSLGAGVDMSSSELGLRMVAAGVRIAIVDVTSADTALTPFKVVRALGKYLQPIHCGYGLERLANPRLKGTVRDDCAPHPVC